MNDPELRKFLLSRMDTAEAARKAAEAQPEAQLELTGIHLELPEVHQHAPQIDDIVCAPTERPRWWVRAMSAFAHALWKYHLPALSWGIADACLWLQTKMPKRRVP